MSRTRTKAHAQAAGVVVQQVEIQEEVKVAVPKSKTIAVEITAPVLEHGKVFLQRVEHCRLTPRQSKALRYLFDGLVAEGATFRMVGPNPEKITGQNDAVRWLLDQVSDAIGLE